MRTWELGEVSTQSSTEKKAIAKLDTGDGVVALNLLKDGRLAVSSRTSPLQIWD